jgi:hypothetical protein
MPNSPTPKLVANCPDACSLSPEKIGQAATEALLAARANGAGAPALAKRAAELLGRPVPSSNMQRHVTHIRELAADEPSVDGPRPTDLQILDSIIVSGFRHSKNWRPTIKDTLDAMKLKTAMTGQSAFEDMLNALEAGLGIAEDEDEDVAPENPEAILAPGEREADDGDDAS